MRKFASSNKDKHIQADRPCHTSRPC